MKCISDRPGPAPVKIRVLILPRFEMGEMAGASETAWFHAAAFGSAACKILNPELMNMEIK